MTSKKSQLKFGEMFAIIFIVWLVLVIGAVWYTNYNKKEIVKINEESSKNLAFERYSFIRNIPYLRVSQLGEVEYTFSPTCY